MSVINFFSAGTDDVVIKEQVCGSRAAASGPEGKRYNLCLCNGWYTSQASTKDYTQRSSPGDGEGGKKPVTVE